MVKPIANALSVQNAAAGRISLRVGDRFLRLAVPGGQDHERREDAGRRTLPPFRSGCYSSVKLKYDIVKVVMFTHWRTHHVEK